MSILPATIDSYDPATRECRVRIEGRTDGSNKLPIAEILYPIGDKSKAGNSEHDTEIEIIEGDKVWVDFLGTQGDRRYPIIVGWRNETSGNSDGWRRFHHENIELIAEKELVERSVDMKVEATKSITSDTISTTITSEATYSLTSKVVTVEAESFTEKSSIHTITTQTLAIESKVAAVVAQTIAVKSPITTIIGDIVHVGNYTQAGNFLSVGTMINNGSNVGSIHTHDGVKSGTDTSAPPK